jgi:hypothetical protein
MISVTNLIAVSYGLNPLPVNGIDATGNNLDENNYLFLF